MEDFRLLESYFEFFYAQEIVKRTYGVVKKNCSGCQLGCLSQTDHSCLYPREQLESYWEEILGEVDEMEILRKWDSAVSVLRDVSPELVSVYKLKIDCRDWRDTDMKTEAWNSKMYKLSRQLMALKNRV